MDFNRRVVEKMLVDRIGSMSRIALFLFFKLLLSRFGFGFSSFVSLLSQEKFTGRFEVTPVVVAIVNEDFLSGLDCSGGHQENAFFTLSGLDLIVGVVGQSWNPAYSSGIVGVAPFGPGCEIGIDASVLGDENGITFMAIVRTVFTFRPSDYFTLVFTDDVAPSEGPDREKSVAGLGNLAGFDADGIRPICAGTFCKGMFLHGRANIGA